METANTAETFVKQGKNTVISIENLKKLATKKNKDRSDLFERFCANEHSFRVYTYMDKAIGQSTEVQSFLQKVEAFGENFTGVNTDFITVVDKKEVENAYQEVIPAYNAMVSKLGFETELL